VVTIALMATRLSRLFRDRPLLVIPAFLALYGYGTIDVADFARLSASPLELNVETSKQFLHFSPLAFFLGYPFTSTVGARWSFAIVMLGGLAFFVAALTRLVAVRYGARRHDAMLMVLASPLLIVLSQYLGKGDAYLVSFTLLLVSTGNPIAKTVLASLVVLSHMEMGLLGLASAVFLGIVPFRTTALGAAAGGLAIMGYHHGLLPALPQSRAAMGTTYLSDSFAAVLDTPVLHLVLTFGAFWFCVFTAWPLNWRWRVAAVGTLLVACATLDFTRVFVLLGLPLIIAVVDRVVPRSGLPDQGMPRWFTALPLCAFVQAHLLSSYVIDSRMPELIGRVLASAGLLD
jgi:hypothetical protein